MSLFRLLGRLIDRIWPADHGFQWTGRSDGHGHTAEAVAYAESERRLEAELNRIHPGYGDLHWNRHVNQAIANTKEQ